MVNIKAVDCKGLWQKLRTWLRDKETLALIGGAAKAVAHGQAGFQLLRMECGIPKPCEKLSLEQFLRRDYVGKCAAAAVGLSAWDTLVLKEETRGQSRKSLKSLWEGIMEMLQGLGLKTDENEDVLGLAGVDLCGVGVRRPEVYIKRGNGVANPFITLRHAEWGHTMAFNLVVHQWSTDRKLLNPKPKEEVVKEDEMSGDDPTNQNLKPPEMYEAVQIELRDPDASDMNPNNESAILVRTNPAVNHCPMICLGRAIKSAEELIRRYMCNQIHVPLVTKQIPVTLLTNSLCTN